MPMPPPKPSTEGRRDRHVRHEIGQIARAVQSHGPLTADELRVLVGGQFWEPGRFDQALAHAAEDGIVVRGQNGVIQAAA
jgi:hypothetical protein